MTDFVRDLASLLAVSAFIVAATSWLSIIH